MSRYLFCCTLGILLVGVLPALPDSCWSPVIYALALVLGSLIICYPGGIVTAFSCVGLGLCWSVLSCQDLLQARVPESWVAHPIWVEGEIADLPQAANGTLRFVVQVKRAEPCASDFPGGTRFDCEKFFRVRLSYFRSTLELPRLRPGEIWRFQVKLKPPHGLVNYPIFDYEAWLLRHKIAATGYVLVKPGPEKLDGPGARRLFQQARDTLREFVASSLLYSPYADLILALAIGDNQAISHEHWDTLSRTGTNHLLIISGLHVSLVIGLIYRLISRIVSWWLSGSKAQVFSIITSSFAAIGYAGIAGFGLPVQRSLIMALVVFGSVLLGRVVQTRNIFLWALLAVTANDPLAAYAAGFWLSFCAVMVLLLLFSGRFQQSRNSWTLFSGAVHAQWGIYVGLFTLTAYLLLQVSVLSPLANIFAIPIISLVVVPCVLLASASWFLIGDPARIVLHIADQVIGHLWAYLDVLAQANLVWVPPGVSAIGAALGLLGGLLLLLPTRLPGRWLSLCLFLPFVMPPPDQLKQGQLRLRIMDVGQGLSVLLQTRGHSLLYDLGARRGERFDMGELVVVPTLRSRGIDRLHKLLISNADNDHAGGASSLLARIDVLEIISGDPANVSDATGIRRHIGSCTSGTHWSWDSVEFTILHPDGSGRWQGNDKSCVLLVTTGMKQVLIPGDISSLVETQLIKAVNQPVELLVVPHHGSDSSSSPGFLNRLRPSYAIFSAGYLNRFDHPNPSILNRYRNRGVVLFATSSDGAVEVEMDASGIRTINGDRQAFKKFWFQN